ncbi:hypothetical protein ACVS9P_08795 [Caproicibacterium sp. NSD3]
MSVNFNKAWAISKINFRHMRATYIITACLLLVGIANLILIITAVNITNGIVDPGNYAYAAAIFAPIFIPAVNFKKIMHLNGKKIDFYWGALFNYIIIAAVVSFANILLYVVTKNTFSSYGYMLNIGQAFGWFSHGIVPAFFQQFFFILLFEIFVHTLTAMQNFWFGWVTDVALVAIISVFTPIPVLRSALVWFFYMIIFNPTIAIQIISCIILSVFLYALYLLILKKQRI